MYRWSGFPANVGVVLPPKARSGVYGVGLAFEITGWVGGKMARQVAPDGKSFACTVFESPGGFIACDAAIAAAKEAGFTTRSEEHTSELQSLMRISYAVFCLKKKNKTITQKYKQ